MSTIIEQLDKHSIVSNNIWRFPAESTKCYLSEINENSFGYAEKLAQLGINSGDRIGLSLENSREYVCLLLAIWRLKAIAVPLRSTAGKQVSYQQYIQYCDNVCDFKLIVYGERNSEKFDSDFISNERITTIPLSYFGQSYIKKNNTKNFSIYPDENDIAILQFSSGSTGNPKGVIVTHKMIMCQLQNILYNHIGSRRGWPIESIASWMPFNHDMGLFIGVLAPIYAGCPNLVAPPSYYMRNPSRWFKFLSEFRVDMTFTTNSVLASTLRMLGRLKKSDEIDLSRLHLYIGAEKVSPVIVRRCYETLSAFKMKEEHVHIGYGMAENALGAACTRTNTITINKFNFINESTLRQTEKTSPNTIELVSLGTPDRFHDITIRDKSDNILPNLTLGEINIKSPCVTPGYYNNSAVTRSKLAMGRLRTGDLGFYFNNELYYYAREDDMIIINGRNIVPDDVEGLVEELSFVRPTASCLIGSENKKTGVSEVNLLVETKENTHAEVLIEYRKKIQSHIYENFNIILNTIIFCVKGSIEKTSSGKKRRKIVQQRYANGHIDLLEINNGLGVNNG